MSLNLDKGMWRRLSFGDVVRNVNVTVRDAEAAGIDRVIAMEHMDPGELKIQRWGVLVDGATFTRRVMPGQTLFGKRRAYQRKVAYAEFEAVCSGDILTFEADETQMLPELLPFLVQSEGFFDHALGTSAGSLSPRTNWRDLSNYEFALPPLEQQRPIADLLWAAERHHAALAAEHAVLQHCQARLGAKRFAEMPLSRSLGDLTTTRSGPSYPATAVSDKPVSGALPVIGIPNTKPDGSVDLAGVGYVTGLPSSVGTVDESSVILIRTNGNRQRIGNVYLPPSEAHGHAVSAFQFLMKASDVGDRDYIYWVLRDPSMQSRMSEGASGTTGLGNLAVKWLNAQEIPWSDDRAERVSVVESLRLVGEALDAVAAESSRLTSLRSSLLDEFFGSV